MSDDLVVLEADSDAEDEPSASRIPEALKFRWFAASDAGFVRSTGRALAGAAGGWAIGSTVGMVLFVVAVALVWIFGVVIGLLLLCGMQIYGLILGVTIAVRSPRSSWCFLGAALGQAAGWLRVPIRAGVPANAFPPAWMEPLFVHETHLWTLIGAAIGIVIGFSFSVMTKRNPPRQIADV